MIWILFTHETRRSHVFCWTLSFPVGTGLRVGLFNQTSCYVILPCVSFSAWDGRCASLAPPRYFQNWQCLGNDVETNFFDNFQKILQKSDNVKITIIISQGDLSCHLRLEFTPLSNTYRVKRTCIKGDTDVINL